MPLRHLARRGATPGGLSPDATSLAFVQHNGRTHEDLDVVSIQLSEGRPHGSSAQRQIATGVIAPEAADQVRSRLAPTPT